MTKKRFSLSLVVAFVAATSVASAQLPLNTVDTPVNVNFATFAGTGFSPTPAAGQLDSNIFAVDTRGTENAVAFGDTVDGSSPGALFELARGYEADPLAIPTGGTGRGIWATNAGSGRAVYFNQTGNDAAPQALKLRAVNNTGGTVTGLDVSYDVYVTNDAPRSNTFTLAVSTDNITYTAIPASQITTVLDADVTPAFNLIDAPSPSRSVNVSGLNIPAGQFVYLRWIYLDDTGSGNRDKIGIDNITVTPRAGGNILPELDNGAVNNSRPTTADNLVFTVEATDADGTIAEARVYTSTDGVSFTANTMTGTAPNFSFNFGTGTNRTAIYYYFEATDNSGGVGSLGSALAPELVYVSNDRPIVGAGEIVINEICHTQNPVQPGGDWVEFYNNSAREIDLSLCGVVDDQFGRTPSRFPIGTIIPVGGYVIIAQDIAGFSGYGPWGGFITPVAAMGFGLSRNGDSVVLLNDIDQELDRVDYLNNLDGWPNIFPDTHFPEEERGSSIELNNPNLDNSIGANWSKSETINGTPGRANGVTSVEGWMLY